MGGALDVGENLYLALIKFIYRNSSQAQHALDTRQPAQVHGRLGWTFIARALALHVRGLDATIATVTACDRPAT